MQVRPQVQIASMIKAMKDVVIPALGTSNKLAVEQASLVVGMLALMASQLPHQARFDRDELARLVAFVDGLKGIDTADATAKATLQAMGAEQAHAATLVAESKHDPSELQTSVATLRTQIGALVTALSKTGESANQQKIEKAVLDLSREQLLRDRSLLKAQGWEPDPAAVPDIASLLA